MILIKNVRYFDGEIVGQSSIAVSGSKIAKIFSGTDCDSSDYEEIIDGQGRLLVPGYIDIHLHGCGGCDVMDGTPESIKKIAAVLAENGTTSFLPTTVTMSAPVTRKAIENIRACMKENSGANILGIHLEGPFINKERKGAQNKKYILEPSIENFDAFVKGDYRGIKRVTLAPEVGKGVELIKYLAQKGICVSGAIHVVRLIFLTRV